MAGSIYEKSKENKRVDIAAREELAGIKLQAMREREKREQDRRKKATDSEYWLCVMFESRDEKEAFLRDFHLHRLPSDKYISAEDLKIGIGQKGGD